MVGRPINESRALAVLMGDKTYEGLVHAKCNTNVRYVSGGGCVHCARVIATEQRDARKFLAKAQAGEIQRLEALVNDGLDIEQETDIPDIEPEDDADARYQESIDDLM